MSEGGFGEGDARFEGATAFVTGAGSGIGKSTAEALLSRGARVIASDREAGRLEPLASQWPERALAWPLDVTDREAVAALPGALPESWRAIDVLVNCAGHDIGGRRPFTDGEADLWAGIIETNVIGLIRVTQALAAGMAARGRGHIVNLGSHLGIRPVATTTGYTASKHAVHGFSETLRMDFAGSGVRVTELCPGRVRTNFAATRAGSQAAGDAHYDEVGECLRPQDIANAIVYALQQPAHVCVSQIVIMPAAQR